MIRVAFLNIDPEQARLQGNAGFRVEGHSSTAAKGQDIVCSAVSALAQTAILSVDRLAGIEQDIQQSSGFLLTSMKTADLDRATMDKLGLLFQFVYIGLKEIALQYPEAVTIEILKS